MKKLEKQKPYDHNSKLNMHTVRGAKSAITAIFGSHLPSSVLDVGCGLGTWLTAFSDLGVDDLDGIDGDWVDQSCFMLPPKHFQVANLNTSFNLGRKYDLVICLEVAEHLDDEHSDLLIQSLCSHSDRILFSAATPHQPGENHLNLHYPEYWQRLFASRGYYCDDSVRWKIWNDPNIECWYRQNMFIATRDDSLSNFQSIMNPVIHPEMLEIICSSIESKMLQKVSEGSQSLSWYLKCIVKKIKSFL
jgi:hypothetical protein